MTLPRARPECAEGANGLGAGLACGRPFDELSACPELAEGVNGFGGETSPTPVRGEYCHVRTADNV